jgi:hypothetical protein
MIRRKNIYLKIFAFILFKSKGATSNRFKSLISPKESGLQKSPELQTIMKQVINILSVVKSKDKLVRVGGDGDGSYVIPINLLNKDTYLVSGGIDNNNRFEIQLAKRGVTGIQVDNSINSPPILHQNLNFIKATLGDREGLNKVTIQSLIKNVPPTKKILIKLDIEGSETSALVGGLSLSDMKKVSCIVLELHNICSICEDPLLLKLLNKIDKSGFKSIYIQANNGVMNYILGGYMLPDNLEVTFVKKQHTKKPKVRDIMELKSLLTRNNKNYASVNLDHFLFYNV